MSTEEGDSGPGRREVAYRLFAAEFDDADFSYAESDEERAPNYVVTPTGARVNRLFVVGVLTEVEPVGEDVLRARVVDPTGAFVVYAGQYQPDAQTFLERADPPAFVAVSGKARTFQPEDSDVIYTSIRPESVNEVDAETRDRWTVGTAERTLDRIGVAASALRSDLTGEELTEALLSAGVEESLASGLPLALEHYGTTGGYLAALRELSLDAARVVADERDEVESLSLAPDQGGSGDLAALASVDLSAVESDDEPPEPEPVTDTEGGDSRAGTAAGSEPSEAETEPEPAETPSADAADGGESVETVTTTETETPREPVETETAAEPDEPSTSAEEVTTPEETTTSDDDVTADDDLTEPDAGEADDIGDFEPGEFDLDEEVREEVEDEYGTEFQSGTEVDDPGEADIETPDPEEAVEAGAPAGAADADAAPGSTGAPAGDESAEPDASAATSDAVSETPDTAESTGADETAPAGETDGADESEGSADVDLEDAVMDAMTDLDDGDGADREDVVASVAEEYGADPDDVEDAIQDALMDGRCYEPDDSTLKPI